MAPRPDSRERPLDAIDNLTLIANGLLHIVFESRLPIPSYFRIAREAHLVLYRSMIEGLRGSANLAVTGRLPKDRSFHYEQGNNSCREIHKAPILGCKMAWSFSEPAACGATHVLGERVDEPENWLIGFYDALAMVQSECFMGHFVSSRPIAVSTNEMKTLEWLHERIRNEYEHFVPKYYSSPVLDLVAASDLCLRLSRTIPFDSFTCQLRLTERARLQDLFAQLDLTRIGTM